MTPTEPAPQETEHPRLGPPVTDFDLGGRMSVRQGQRIDFVRFDWRHTPERDELTLTSPLGQGLARLTRAPDGAQLRLADGRELGGEDWRALVANVLEAELPLDELPEWLRGARPERQAEIDGWRVHVTEVSEISWPPLIGFQVSRQFLPRVIEASRGDMRLRLLVDQRN